MSLTLNGVSLTVQGAIHVYETNLAVENGKVNILLGATLSGKTSIMRLMAGLDFPTTGRIYYNGEDVTNVRVQDRSVAMVYQSFINYPSLTVYENIASPLRLMNLSGHELDRRVKEMADLVHMTPYLQRFPLELSGGQQQRCALARSLVKQSGLVLLDEPLANLDYKLREELRSEMTNIFQASNTIFVYATTEPEEALLLGGNTIALHEGRVTQSGATRDVYHNPQCKITAGVFSNPPMNMVDMHKTPNGILLAGEKISIGAEKYFKGLDDGHYEVGFRANHFQNKRQNKDCIKFNALLDMSEITGSATFLHVSSDKHKWVSVLEGIHHAKINTVMPFYLDLKYAYVFSMSGVLVQPAKYIS